MSCILSKMQPLSSKCSTKCNPCVRNASTRAVLSGAENRTPYVKCRQKGALGSAPGRPSTLWDAPGHAPMQFLTKGCIFGRLSCNFCPRGCIFAGISCEGVAFSTTCKGVGRQKCNPSTKQILPRVLCRIIWGLLACRGWAK